MTLPALLEVLEGHLSRYGYGVHHSVNSREMPEVLTSEIIIKNLMHARTFCSGSFAADSYKDNYHVPRHLLVRTKMLGLELYPLC